MSAIQECNCDMEVKSKMPCVESRANFRMDGRVHLGDGKEVGRWLKEFGVG
jgi:hypothetical protein